MVQAKEIEQFIDLALFCTHPVVNDKNKTAMAFEF
jgi:hypothetical protein